MKDNYLFPILRRGLIGIFCLMQAHSYAQSLASVQVPPNGVPPQSSAGSRSLRDVLKELEKQYGVFFTYKNTAIDDKYVQKEPSFPAKNDARLDKVLTDLLAPNGLQFEKIDNIYFIIPAGDKVKTKTLKKTSDNIQKGDLDESEVNGDSGFRVLSAESLQQTIDAKDQPIQGKVSNDQGEVLPGVSVSVKGTTVGTVTDAGGKYSITVLDNNTTLVFSFIGYATEEVLVGSRSVIDINLVPDIKSLSEVVVIGYGEKNRKLLTESIGTVSAREIQQLPVASADAAIQGRVSGVQVTNVDGTPGSPVAIRIRGVGTTGNTQPLFVIDGIPTGFGEGAYGTNTNPLSSVNPADIESVSVLKDASAAAVYGVRAANGVVLITTKRGKTGKPRIAFDGYYGVQNFPKTFDWNNTQQYVALTQEAYSNRNTQLDLQPGNTAYQVLHPDLLAATPNNVLGINTDWQKAVLHENAPIQNYNVAVSGGSEASNYHVSAGYFGQQAMVKKWDLERFTFRANSDYKVGKRFKFGQTLAISYQDVKRGSSAQGDGFLYAAAANQPPFFSIYETPERPILNNRYGFSGNANVAGLTTQNPIGVNEIVSNIDQQTRLLGGIYAQLEILPGLSLRSAASIDFSYTRGTGWSPGYTAAELGIDRSLNNFNDGRGEGYTQVFTNTLNYQKTFGDHTFGVLAGTEYTKIRNNGLSYGGYDYQSTDPAFYRSVKNQQGQEQDVNGAPFRVYANAGSSLGNDAYVGYIGRVSYDYKQKYLLTATVRRDGTAHFAPEHRWGTFPAVSAAWRISQEPFFVGISAISDLKIRASWGQLGNANTSAFPYVFRVSFTPDYGLGSTTRQAPSQAKLVNRDLVWEKVETTDFGVDVSFFENKLSLLATYYHRNSRDFLFDLPIPMIGGFANIYGPNSNLGLPVNAGNVVNQGIELELGYNTTIAREWRVNVSGNLTTVKNRLTALAPNIQEFSSGDYRTAVGFPIGYFYGYKTNGLYQTPADTDGALPDQVSGYDPTVTPNNSTHPQPGDIRFVDNNGPSSAEESKTGQQFSGKPDGKIGPQDRTYLGKTIPDFYYGLSIGANYKGMDLSILFQGVSGVQVYNAYRAANESLTGSGRNQLTTTQNRWTGPNTSNSMPRAVSGDPNANNRFSDRWIENAGFLRLKNVQLGYSLPQSWLGKTKAFSSARIYVAATNLFRITKYTGLDPEVVTYGSNSNQLGAGTDEANIPQPRTYQAGFQVQF